MTPRTRCIIKSCIRDLYDIEGTGSIIARLSDVIGPDPEPITAEEHQSGFKLDEAISRTSTRCVD